MPEIIKIIGERETQKKQQQERQKRTRGTKAIMKGWGLNEFVVCLS